MSIKGSIKKRAPITLRRVLGKLRTDISFAVRRRRGIKAHHPAFLVVAPSFSHKSGGVRALYRLCYQLNAAGYSAAVTPMGWRIDAVPDWPVAVHNGPAGDSIVIYPEAVSGNPLQADKVVRWTLNTPGLLGGDAFYPDEEMVFVASPAQLATVSKSVSKPLGPHRVLSVGLIDPAHIYPDPAIEKTLDCIFTHKGEAIRARFPLPNEASLQRIEDITPTMASLGDVLRRTRTLYSYDHKSTILKEAVICGCRVLVVHEDGRLLDPEKCGCVESNVFWEDGLRENYVRKYHDCTFVDAFIRELTMRWHVPREPR
ncbi:MAG TPA: hypothetical protein VK430_10190 [Xanthobacteraceae bacterium]|nr:hypothetical protein [Xanthobacteraceae bacterium]